MRWVPIMCPWLLPRPALRILLANSTYVGLAPAILNLALLHPKINNYNIETADAKATAMLNLVKELQDRRHRYGEPSHRRRSPGSLRLHLQLRAVHGARHRGRGDGARIRMTLLATPALLAQQKTDNQNVADRACSRARVKTTVFIHF
ncbi:hypothetical protein B0H13DRAFT_1925907 [Mycena leptocephala]|nr:hypothetical protein B0H13DRAFT_1925907 [Mycena leptocephala]